MAYHHVAHFHFERLNHAQELAEVYHRKLDNLLVSLADNRGRRVMEDWIERTWPEQETFQQRYTRCLELALLCGYQYCPTCHGVNYVRGVRCETCKGLGLLEPVHDLEAEAEEMQERNLDRSALRAEL